jgi:hypothetical protein
MEFSAYQSSHTKVEDPSVVSTSQTICTTCFNLDLACVPSERYSDAGASRAKHGTRRILTKLEYIRLSTSEGCPACAILNEGISVHRARVAHESQSPWVTATDPYMLYIEFRPGHGVDIGLFYETEEGETAKIIIEYYTRLGLKSFNTVVSLPIVAGGHHLIYYLQATFQLGLHLHMRETSLPS